MLEGLKGHNNCQESVARRVLRGPQFVTRHYSLKVAVSPANQGE
ncbi:MAG: hypothetical protein JWP89_3780 [Schlesneria sp.]|nr:hypothetical protein [Schlesneria sp.]